MTPERWALVGVAVLSAALLAGAYAAGRNAERAAQRAAAAEVARQVAEQRLEDERRVGALAVELERLRARPARVRTVTKEVVRRVAEDRDCPSLPADWRVLWSAGGDPAPAAPAGVADGAPTGLAGAARVAIGDAAAGVAEARARFEQCTGQLTGLQRYVREVVRPE